MDIEPSLNDYWRVLQRRKWVILSILSLTSIATAINTQLQIPLYRTQAVVKFEPPSTRMVGNDTSNWDQNLALQTQLRILGSQDISDAVLKRLSSSPTKDFGSFSANRVPDSNLINIVSVGADPVAITQLANTVVDVYLERDAQEHSQSARKALEDVSTRRQEMETSLRELEEKRQAYLEQHHSSSLGASMQNMLLDLEARKRELLNKFTTQHPDVISIEQRIAAAQAKLATIPSQEIELERLNRDIKINEELYITLSRQMEESKITLASVPSYATPISRASVPGAPFYPNKKAKNMLGTLFGLFLGLVAAVILENLDISISTIEDIEKTLGVPVLGVVPRLGSKKRWGEMKAKLLRKERYPMDIFRSLLLFHHNAKSPTIEVYHSLRSSIQSQLPQKKNLVLTFTSTGVAEGKTLTAVNFCLAAAHAGLKTLLIGADIRRPVLYRIFGLPKLPGLMEALSGKEPWENTIRGTVDFLMGEIDLDKLLGFNGIDNFKVMGGWAANSSDVVNLFSSGGLPRLIEELRPHFDLVVFDCPPVLLFVDAVLIGAQTDGVVMIYRAGKMAKQALRRAKDQVASAKAPIVGVILNDMQSTDMEPRYGYYYDYGHYAGKEEE